MRNKFQGLVYFLKGTDTEFEVERKKNKKLMSLPNSKRVRGTHHPITSGISRPSKHHLDWLDSPAHVA
jgi:hypothetical protein